MKIQLVTLLKMGFVTFSGVLLFTAPLQAAEERVSLNSLIETALKLNSSLHVAAARVDGAKSSVTAVTTLPPPMVGLGVMGMDSPFSGKMQSSYEISQEIPFPTKIIFNRNARSHDADSRHWEEDETKRTVIKNVKKAFFTYYRAHEEVDILEERLRLLKEHLRILRSKPVASSMLQAHIVTMAGEIESAEAELILAAQELTTSKFELNLAIGQSADTPLAPPETPALSTLPKVGVEDIAQTPKVMSLISVRETMESERTLSYQGWVPDFSLMYRYNRRYDSISSNHEFMVGMTLPFVPFWSTSAKLSEANAKVIEASAQLRQAELETTSEVKTLEIRAKALRDVYLRLREKVLPAAEKRLHFLHRISQTDLETLDEHRMAFENLSAVKSKIAKTRADYEVAVAGLESLASVR